MGMPKMCAGIGVELISERISFVHWTLSDVRNTVVVLSASLMNSVPMDNEFQTVHVVQHVNDNLVSFANLYSDIYIKKNFKIDFIKRKNKI